MFHLVLVSRGGVDALSEPRSSPPGREGVVGVAGWRDGVDTHIQTSTDNAQIDNWPNVLGFMNSKRVHGCVVMVFQHKNSVYV